MRDPSLAARKVGAEDGLDFLSQKEVKQELTRLRRQFQKVGAGELAKLALCRIALSQPQQDQEGKIMDDGFSLEKCGGKQADYKFWDKIKACELLIQLAQLQQSETQNGFTSVLDALQQGAEAVREDFSRNQEGEKSNDPEI